MSASAATESSPSRRILTLDVLRGIAILLVLGRHLDFFPLWTKVGWAGVDLFFVLSGFLISGLLFQEWQRHGAINFKRFYIRRALKIYPAFYVLLLITVAVNYIVPGIPPYPVTLKSMLAEVFFVQNYFSGIWPQTWSLAVEEHFYILLPIALWLLYRRRRGAADPFSALPAIFFITATAELLLRTVTTWHLTTAATENLYVKPTHLRIDALLLGVLLSYYRYFLPEKLEPLRRGAAPVLLIVLAFVLLVMIPPNNPIMHTVGFTLVYFGFGLLLIRTVDLHLGKYAALFVAPLAKIGYYSYSIYLWHGFVFRLLPRTTLAGFAGCVATAILLGIIMAKLVEYPVLTLRDRLLPVQPKETYTPPLTPPDGTATTTI